MKMKWLGAWALAALVGGCAGRLASDIEAADCPAQAIPAASTTDSAARWIRMITADPAVSLCVPAGYTWHNRWGEWSKGQMVVPWTRIVVSRGVARTEMHDLSRAEDSAEIGPPPSLRSATSCVADCIEVRRYRVREEVIGGQVAEVETGYLNGGFGGYREVPAILVRWRLSSDGWVVILGEAANGEEFREIVAAIRSARFEQVR